MKTILWYQNPGLISDDILMVNGENITPPTNSLYVTNFDFLYNIEQKNKSLVLGQTYLYKLKDGFFAKGAFETKDKLGRKTPFMFYSDERNRESFIARFEKTAKLANMEYSDQLLNDLRSLSSGLSIKIFLGITALILALLLFIFSIK